MSNIAKKKHFIKVPINSKKSITQEKNDYSLLEKIKTQENEISYLKKRLSNYDDSINEITCLNIEINNLNAIIKKQNELILKQKKDSYFSKSKLNEVQSKNKLLLNNNSLMSTVMNLDKENNQLKQIIQNKDPYSNSTSFFNTNDCQKNNYILSEEIKKKNLIINELHNQLHETKGEYKKISEDYEKLQKKQLELEENCKNYEIKLKKCQNCIVCAGAKNVRDYYKKTTYDQQLTPYTRTKSAYNTRLIHNVLLRSRPKVHKIILNKNNYYNDLCNSDRNTDLQRYRNGFIRNEHEYLKLRKNRKNFTFRNLKDYSSFNNNVNYTYI